MLNPTPSTLLVFANPSGLLGYEATYQGKQAIYKLITRTVDMTIPVTDVTWKTLQDFEEKGKQPMRAKTEESVKK